jgi:hypothetical protein
MNNWNGIVSLFISCMELIFLINLFVFAEKNKLNWLAIGIVILLLGYQTIEYLICGIGLSSSFMAYFAFVDITFLPPLNLLFILTLFRYKNKFIPLIFLPALFFIIYYSIIISDFEVVKCTVLYATYNYPVGDLYGFFYYLPLLTAFILILKNMIGSNEQKFPISLEYLFYGHLSLIIPVAIAFTLLSLDFTGMRDSIESILCKFAFLYCLVLVYFALSNKLKSA